MEEIETCLQPPQLKKETAAEDPPSTKIPTSETSPKRTTDELETKTQAPTPPTTLSTMTTTAAVEVETMKTKTNQKEKDAQQSSLTSPEKDSSKETSTTTTFSPTSVMISSSLIEETYRSIDVHAMLGKGPKKKSMKNDASDSTSTSSPTSPGVSSSSSPPKTPSPSSKESSNSTITTITPATSGTKKDPTAQPNEVEEADILVDAFETMADIATELFSPATYSAVESTFANAVNFDDYNENEEDDYGTGGGFRSTISRIMNDNDTGTMEDKNDNDDSRKNDADIPFDERGKGRPTSSRNYATSTPTCSNRKNMTPDRNNSGMARMRSKQHNDVPKHYPPSNKKKDSRSSEEIYKQKQRRWEKNKLKANYDSDDDEDNSIVHDYKKGRRKGGGGGGGGEPASTVDVDDCGGILGEFEKQFTNVMHQSQAMILEALVGPPSNKLGRDDSYSSSDTGSYDSDSDYSNESESTYSDFSQDENDHHYSNHHRSSGGGGGSNSRHHNYERKMKRKETKYSQRSGQKSVHFDDDGKEGDFDDFHDTNMENVEHRQQQQQPQNAKASTGLKAFLHDITSEGIKIKWHKPLRTTFVRASSGPMDVVVCIQINDSNDTEDSVEPNLVWEICSDNKSVTPKARFQHVKTVRQRISLFDIASVQKAVDSMNLHSYPHAVPEHSILITLHDGNIFFFEAKDEARAKLVIHGLRWISARLVFNLLAGNRNVCAEMLPMSMNNNASCQELSTEVMRSVTDHLVDKSLKRLSERSTGRSK